MDALSVAPLPNIFDHKNLADIKRAARGNDPEALKAAAKQFEALFLQMVLKSMRDAAPRDSLFGGEQTRFYESLLDQQLSQVLSARGRGIGLAAMMEKQLSPPPQGVQGAEDGLPLERPLRPLPLERQYGAKPIQNPDGRPLPLGSGSMPELPAPSTDRPGGVQGTVSVPVRDFVSRVMPHALDVAQSTGIPAHFMVAQAALETGWGKSMPRRADGTTSYNLFGIKAGREWNGPVAEAATVEFVDGVPERQVQRFRAYASFADSFRDYSTLMLSNPRYAGVLNTSSPAAFARSLQSAGYATDPAYAAKLERIIGSIS